MGTRKNGRGLQFACECVSSSRGYSDPWAAIAQRKLLNDGTKERILNLVAHEPRTIARLAKELGLSQPAVHTHVADMLASELLREATEWQKAHPAENYYEPAFPVIGARDRALLDPICRELAHAVAELVAARQPELAAAMRKSDLPARGWDFADVAQYCYADVQRGARKLLEQRGVLPTALPHRNGIEWLFWAVDAAAPPHPR